jgi:multimeric flavodoxin WrbA
MYAIAINGSPRKSGNTESLLKEVLSQLNKAGWETELVRVGGTAIRGCIAWLGESIKPNMSRYPK